MKAILLFPFTIVTYIINVIWDFYWRRTTPVKVNARVISVGNLVVGGSGKTTLTAFIARKLQAEGKRVAVVARGYGRPENPSTVICTGENADWRKSGDEPAALAMMIPGLVIYVDTVKTRAAEKAAAAGFTHIIVDDGFQHRRLYRDVDIVCLNGSKPFDNGLLLPLGRLREPVSRLKRADIIVMFGETKSAMTRVEGYAPIFKAKRKTTAVKTLEGQAVDITGKKIIGFCGLANPESFRKSIEEIDCEMAGFITFRDHHIYGDADLKKIKKRFMDTGSEAAVTTLKDAVKLKGIWPSEIPLRYIEIEIELDKRSEFFRLVDA